jgi:succinoglycan biosynthesis transport protein ExoP
VNQQPMDLRDYLALLWRSKWMIAAVAITTAGVALFLSARQAPVYTSTAEVVVRPARFDPTQPSAQVGLLDMDTEVRIANSPAVASIALKQLADRHVRPGSVSAVEPGDTTTIQFVGVSTDPSAAQATAQVFADAYLTFRRQDILLDLQASRAPLTRQLDTINDSLAKTSAAINTATNADEKQRLQGLYLGLLGQQGAILAKLADFPTPEAIRVGEVLQQARLPGAPSGGNDKSTAILGVLIGLTLGVTVALFKDRLSQGVRGQDDLELHSGAPVLGNIPRIRSHSGSVIAVTQPDSAAAEAYKALRVRTIHAAEGQGIKSLLVTSAVAGEGKTSTVANLGVALAQAGRSVVLMSADLRRPRLHEYFPGESEAGLADVLAGTRKAQEALTWTGIENLWILQAGPTASPELLDLLGSALMTDVLSELAGFADMVLIDAPPLLSASDATALARLADGVLLVTDPRRVQRHIVEQARLELELVGANIIGVVVNNYDPRRFRPYTSRYRYSAYGPEQGPGRAPAPHATLPGAQPNKGNGQAQSVEDRTR